MAMGFEFNSGNLSGGESSKLSFLTPPANPLVDSGEPLNRVGVNTFNSTERYYRSSRMSLDSIPPHLHLPNFNESWSGLKYVAPYCNGGLWEPERTRLVQHGEDWSIPSSSIHIGNFNHGPLSLKRLKTCDKTDSHVPLTSLVLDDGPKNLFRPKSGTSFADVSPDEVKKALDSLDSIIAKERFLESFEPLFVQQLVKKSETTDESNCKDGQNRIISNIIEATHNLSKWLLYHCSNGTCELSKQDLKSLEKISNNIDMCMSINFEQELFNELRQGINMGCMQVEAIEISGQKPGDALDHPVCNQNSVGSIDADGGSSSELDDSSISDQSSQDLLAKEFEEKLNIEENGTTDPSGITSDGDQYSADSSSELDKLAAELNASSISDQSFRDSSGITSDWNQLCAGWDDDDSSDWEYVSMEEHFY